MATSFWTIRFTLEKVPQWACKLDLRAPCWLQLWGEANWPRLHLSGLFLHRTIQCLRLGDDVRDAAHCLRHSRVRLRILQSCGIQQKLSQRERWERLRRHDSLSALFNFPSVMISGLERVVLNCRAENPCANGSGSLMLLVTHRDGLVTSAEKKKNGWKKMKHFIFLSFVEKADLKFSWQFKKSKSKEILKL